MKWLLLIVALAFCTVIPAHAQTGRFPGQPGGTPGQIQINGNDAQIDGTQCLFLPSETVGPVEVACTLEIIGLGTGCLQVTAGVVSNSGGTCGSGAINRLQPVLGTALSSGDFAFSGWGAGAAISGITGTDTEFTFTMTAGTSPSMDPTVTLTYHDGAWVTITSTLAQMTGGLGVVSDIPSSSTITQLTLTYDGWVVAGQTYTISAQVAGNSNVTNFPASVNPVVKNPTATQTIVQPAATSLTVGGSGLFNATTSITAPALIGSALVNGQCLEGVGTAPNVVITSTGNACSAAGTVTTFTAPSGSWPTWLIPTVTNSTTTPNLAVATASTPANEVVASPTSGGSGALAPRALVVADIPNPLNQSTTGNAGTATALASAPSLCPTGQAPTGVLANGNATGCVATAAVQTVTRKVLGSNVSLPSTTLTTVDTQSVTMPSSGCPCRVFISISYWVAAVGGSAPFNVDGYVTDGTSNYAFSEGGTGNSLVSATLSSTDITADYSNSAAVTFTVKAEASANASVQAAGTVTGINSGHMVLTVVTSN
jgi:hypothetical protein